MPTYEYKNIETGELYEFKQSMRDDALTHHPDTGAAIKRIVSMPGIAFKGSGFYANDSRAKAPGASRPSGEKSSGTAGGDGPASEKAAPDKAVSEKTGPKEAASNKAGGTSGSDASAAPARAVARPAASTGGE